MSTKTIFPEGRGGWNLPHSDYAYERINRRLVQDGGVEGCALTPSCQSTRITTNCWTVINGKTLELTRKDTPHPKTREKPQWDGRRGTITIKSNPITAGWVTHRLEKTYTTKSTQWSEGSEPHVRLPSLGSGNGRRNPQRIRLWRPVGFDCRTSTGLGETETPLLEGTHEVVRVAGPRGKEQWPHSRLNQTYLLMLEGLLKRWGVAVAHRGNKDTGSRSSEKSSLTWALLESAISPTKEPVGSSAGSPQAKQLTGREASPTHQQTSRLKFYWALPTRATPSSTSPSHQEACISLLDSLIHQRADSRSKNYSLWKENHNHRKIDKMKRQRTMSQMKEQGKSPEK